jgi:spermidine synthase
LLACRRAHVQGSPMLRREVLDTTTTPDGQALLLVREAGHYVIRVGGVPLMTSATFGSEQAMAQVAAEVLGRHTRPKVLVGGLGMGFTLRAALDVFGPGAQITVAELLPCIVAYSRGVLGHLARHPLKDRRVRVHEGDVRTLLTPDRWDVVLMDVDNGPDAFTTASNASLYSATSVERLRRTLLPKGVLVAWSAYASPSFESKLRSTGMHCEVRRVKARGEIRKGATHFLYVARAPGRVHAERTAGPTRPAAPARRERPAGRPARKRKGSTRSSGTSRT